MSDFLAAYDALPLMIWTTGPANNSFGYYCPIVVGKTSGIARICD